MTPAPGRERRHITVTGVVQGVGFRPFVYTLAEELGLTGWVTNNAQGVEAEVEGPAADVAAFCSRIGTRPPPLAVVESVEHRAVPLENDGSVFTIRPSSGGPGRTLVSPDTATCDACLSELADPADRRYRHPFITCTHCGPRFTIVTSLPYDRDSTTMAGFPMCADCAREYADPADRRFHAQPIACPACGPRLTLRTGPDDPGELRDGQALAEARRLLAEGAVVAVKGIGGYHLACDAGDPAAVRTLRKRKNRGGKPFAVLAGSLETVRRLAHVGPAEEELLLGPRKPVVLLRRRAGACDEIAAGVAPGSPDLGFMLPYTPVHRLLLGLPGDPPGPAILVMTSGNRSGEPIVTDDAEALTRLAGLADAWLAHDRPVHVPCDDSVVRVCAGAELPVRRSRGYAPFPIALPVPVIPALAVGGDLKNTFCAGDGRYAWLSAHVGDMDDLATLTAFERATGHLTDLTAVAPRLLVADRHPGYRATQWARRAAEERGLTLRRVQHHHAHVASAMAEHGLDGSAPVIGVAFDGTGYGDDGAVWGGEVLLADYDGYRRFAHLGYVPLPSGDAAVRNPYRMALSHLRAAGLPWRDELPCAAAATPEERRLLERQLDRGSTAFPRPAWDASSTRCPRSRGLPSGGVRGAGGDGAGERGAGRPGWAARRRRAERRVPVHAESGPSGPRGAADRRSGAGPGRRRRGRPGRCHGRAGGTSVPSGRGRSGPGGVHGGTSQDRHPHGRPQRRGVLQRPAHRGLRRRPGTRRLHRTEAPQGSPNDGGLALGQLIVAARARD